MSHLKNKLIDMAMDEYESILPCADRKSLLDCFTVEKGELLFWFNTEDRSTHLLKLAI